MPTSGSAVKAGGDCRLGDMLRPSIEDEEPEDGSPTTLSGLQGNEGSRIPGRRRLVLGPQG
jgi:hypothetical protein